MNYSEYILFSGYQATMEKAQQTGNTALAAMTSARHRARVGAGNVDHYINDAYRYRDKNRDAYNKGLTLQKGLIEQKLNKDNSEPNLQQRLESFKEKKRKEALARKPRIMIG